MEQKNVQIGVCLCKRESFFSSNGGTKIFNLKTYFDSIIFGINFSLAIILIKRKCFHTRQKLQKEKEVSLSREQRSRGRTVICDPLLQSNREIAEEIIKAKTEDYRESQRQRSKQQKRWLVVFHASMLST
jgi:hypothetical protein